MDMQLMQWPQHSQQRPIKLHLHYLLWTLVSSTKHPEAGSVGISPGCRINLRAKLFAQIDMVH